MKVTGMVVGKLELNPGHGLKRDHAKRDNQVRATEIDGVWFSHIHISLRTDLSDTCMDKSIGFPS